MRRPVQRGHAVGLRRVHVGVPLEQRANRRAVHFFGGVCEECLGCGAAEGDCGEQERDRDREYGQGRLSHAVTR